MSAPGNDACAFEHADCRPTTLRVYRHGQRAVRQDDTGRWWVTVGVQADALRLVDRYQFKGPDDRRIPVRLRTATDGGIVAEAELPMKNTGDALEYDTEAPLPPVCEECGKLGRKRCSGCRVARYCDASCQRRHWKTHRPHCCASIAVY